MDVRKMKAMKLRVWCRRLLNNTDRPPSLAGQVTTVTHAVCYTVWTGSQISALKGKAAFNQPVNCAVLLIHIILYRREPLVSLLACFLFDNVYEGGGIYKTEHWNLSKSHLNEQSLLYLERKIRLLRSLWLLRLSRRGHFLLRWGNLFLRPESTFMYPRQGYLQPQSKFICMQLKWSHYISLGTTNDLIVNSFAYLYVLGG